MAHHRGDLFDYEDGKEGARPIDREIPFLIALPTTAGTGSEVGRSTVISDDQTKIKKIIFSPRILPQVVFADPELTLELPPAITAATGMDAITHLVEAYLAKDFHPICDGIALEGLKIAARTLPECVKNGKNVEARGWMLLASMMGAIAFQKGLGVTHSCAHALSTVCDVHHGLANGVMMPFALAFNREAAAVRFSALAHAAGTGSADAAEFFAWLLALRQELGIPKNLSEIKVGAEHVERLTEIATADGCHLNNPRPVARADFERIFREAMNG
jgi:hypothetical protein